MPAITSSQIQYVPPTTRAETDHPWAGDRIDDGAHRDPSEQPLRRAQGEAADEPLVGPEVDEPGNDEEEDEEYLGTRLCQIQRDSPNRTTHRATDLANLCSLIPTSDALVTMVRAFGKGA